LIEPSFRVVAAAKFHNVAARMVSSAGVCATSFTCTWLDPFQNVVLIEGSGRAVVASGTVDDRG
jgi:hypothetical protein